MKYAIYSGECPMDVLELCELHFDVINFVGTLEDAKRIIALLIAKAEELVGDLEGHYPDWANEITLLEVKAGVTVTPEGLRLA